MARPAVSASDPFCFKKGCPEKDQIGEGQLVGGFKHVLFSSLFGEMIQFDEHFSKGLKLPTRKLGLEKKILHKALIISSESNKSKT